MRFSVSDLTLNHLEGIFWRGTVSLIVGIFNNPCESIEHFFETLSSFLVSPAAFGTFNLSEALQSFHDFWVGICVDEPYIHEVRAFWIFLDLVEIHHWAICLGFSNHFCNWRCMNLHTTSDWMCDMSYKVFTLLIEILGNILGRQVNIAVMGEIWIGLKLFDHVNLLSLSLIALSSFL